MNTMKFSTINGSTTSWGTEEKKIQLFSKTHKAEIVVEVKDGVLVDVRGEVSEINGHHSENVNLYKLDGGMFSDSRKVSAVGINWGAWGTQSITETERFTAILTAATESARIITGRYITKDDEECKMRASIEALEAAK